MCSPKWLWSLQGKRSCTKSNRTIKATSQGYQGHADVKGCENSEAVTGGIFKGDSVQEVGLGQCLEKTSRIRITVLRCVLMSMRKPIPEMCVLQGGWAGIASLQ